MVESTWTAGILKGERQGIEKGIAKGRKEGREEGEARGRKQEKEAIAASLLHSGLLDMEKIASMTGLTVEEVEGLKSEQ